MQLGSEEARVLGCLVEKQLTTPQQYPLTLNALLAACNQASNREPVVDYDEAAVETALGGLKDRALVRFVLPSHGRSVVRYRQVLDEALGLDPRRLGLLAVLLLRGPQTAGELRVRTERMVDFADPAEVERELEAMAAHDEALVRRVDRRAGQKEDRFAEQLTATGTAGEASGPSGPAPQAVSAPVPGPAAPAVAPVAAIEDLQAEMAAIRSAVGELRAALEALRSSLGG